MKIDMKKYHEKNIENIKNKLITARNQAVILEKELDRAYKLANYNSFALLDDKVGKWFQTDHHKIKVVGIIDDYVELFFVNKEDEQESAKVIHRINHEVINTKLSKEYHDN